MFDTVGGDVAARSFAVLKPGGRAAFIASGAQAPKPERGDVTSACGRRSAAPAPRMERIAELIAAAPCAPPEITLFPLAEAAEAHPRQRGPALQGQAEPQMH